MGAVLVVFVQVVEFFVGQIVAAYGATDSVRDSERDDQEILASTPLLAYLQPGRWAQIGMTYSFPFAEGMKK